MYDRRKLSYYFTFFHFFFYVFTVCDSDKYGVNCQENCSIYCADPENCDNQNGECSPCKEWRIGDKCDVELGKKYSLLCLVLIATCLINLQ